MSKSHQCQEVLVILLLMFTIWETVLHKHNYLPLDLSVLPLFQGLILEPVRTGTQTFLSMQPYLYPFQSYTPMAGVDKESSEDAAFYLAMIQADRQVWPVSHLKHIKFSVVNTIVCVHTHTCCASLHIHISPSVYYKLICMNASHSTHYENLQGFIPGIPWSLWAVIQSHQAVSSSCNLINEPLPALGALLALVAVCGTQQLPTGELVLWEKLAIPSTECLLTPCLMYGFSMAFWVTCSARL